MRKLMGHHGGKLCFVVSGLDRASVYENKATREGKRVDGLVVNAMKLPGIGEAGGVQMLHETFSDFREISIHSRIIAHRHRPLDLIGRLAAQLNVLLGSEGIDSRLELGLVGKKSGSKQKDKNRQPDHGASEVRCGVHRLPPSYRSRRKMKLALKLYFDAAS